MLKSITLRNFKSFAGEPQTIPFAPVTIFVGANGSGKSNAIDAIRFLKGFGRDLSLTEIVEGQRALYGFEEPGIRGGFSELCWSGTDEFEVELHSLLPEENPSVVASMREPSGHENTCVGAGPIPFEHSLTCRIDAEASFILRESGLQPDDLTDDSHELLRDRFSRINTDEGPGVEVRGERYLFGPPVVSSKQSVLWALTKVLPPDHSRRFQSLLQLYRSIGSFDFQPELMREYVSIAHTGLGRHGENLSAALKRIVHDQRSKQTLVDWISTFCAPKVVDVQFEETKHQSVLLELVENDSGESDSSTNRVISAKSLSDGTLRFAAMLAAVFGAPKGSVLLFEEIETGLHPTRVHLLLEMFEQLAESRGIQIVATTHSPQALLALSKEAQRNAVLFYRSPERPGSLVTRLGDIPHFDDVMAEGRIDELLVEGWMEFAAT